LLGRDIDDEEQGSATEEGYPTTKLSCFKLLKKDKLSKVQPERLKQSEQEPNRNQPAN